MLVLIFGLIRSRLAEIKLWSKCWSKIEIFGQKSKFSVKNRNFGPKSTFCSKIKILLKHPTFSQTLKFGQKSKFRSKIKILVKHRNFGQKRNFVQKSKFWSKIAES